MRMSKSDEDGKACLTFLGLVAGAVGLLIVAASLFGWVGLGVSLVLLALVTFRIAR